MGPQMVTSPKRDSESAHSSFTEIPVRDTSVNSNPAADLPPDAGTTISPNASMTEDVLMAARNKLASSVATYNTFRPLSADREGDYSFEDDMEYNKYDRHIRSYDNARNKSTRSSFRSSYLYPHRI